MSKIAARIFGSDIDEVVKKKLELRQNISANKLWEPRFTTDADIKEYTEALNVPGAPNLDLSSRIPFARLWTAVQVVNEALGDATKIDKSEADLTDENFNFRWDKDEEDKLQKIPVAKSDIVILWTSNYSAPSLPMKYY